MKTVGEVLKEARAKKRFSLKKVESGTKIKKEFIEAIENSDWLHLPDFTVVAGFVKNLASHMGVNQKSALALLKRDYPPKKISINPKPDVGGKFTWTPKYTSLVGVLVVVLAIFGYLGFEYYKFNSPPALEVQEPNEGDRVISKDLIVTGKTDPDAVVKINNQMVLLNEDGSFSAKIEIFEGTKEIIVEAISRSGKKATVTRKIVPDLKD